jgi:hypothetical protein
MKTAMIFIFFLVLSSGAGAQNFGRSSRAAPGNAYKLSADAQVRIEEACGRIIARANRTSPGDLSVFCQVRSLNTSVGELGPWAKFVDGLVKLFIQARRLIYVGAVFILLFILVEGVYRAEAQWMKLGTMVIGLVILAGAEMFVRMATGQIRIEDIQNGEMSVDCRRPNEALYRCSGDSVGATNIDDRFIFTFQRANEAKGARTGGLW